MPHVPIHEQYVVLGPASDVQASQAGRENQSDQSAENSYARAYAPQQVQSLHCDAVAASPGCAVGAVEDVSRARLVHRLVDLLGPSQAFGRSACTGSTRDRMWLVHTQKRPSTSASAAVLFASDPAVWDAHARSGLTCRRLSSLAEPSAAD